MKLPLDPNAELLVWGPVPMRSILAYADAFKGLFNEFPKLFPGYSWPKALIIVYRERLVWLHELKELNEHGGALFVERMLPKESRENARAAWREVRRELQEMEHEIENTELSSLPDGSLAELWQRFHEQIDRFWAHSSLPELSNYGSVEILKERIAALVPAEDIGSVMEVLTAPESPSFYQEEEIDLAETHDLAAHQRMYFWLNNSYTNVEVLPVAFFEKRQADVQSNIRDTIRARFAEVAARKDEMRQRYSLPQDVMDMADAIADGIVWQDTRKKEIWIYIHYEYLLLQELSRRVGVSEDRLLLLTSWEIADLFAGRVQISDFVRRNEGVASIFDDTGSMTIEDADAAKWYWEMYVESRHDAAVTDFKGVVASKGAGLVRGRVRIVLDAHTGPALVQDEILVTTMTTPEYVFLMKNAVAIVTDTGGLTSHAAIVSRELGVPCIVGTKIATQVLKDGDLVEVDAESGIVRKL